MPDNEKEGVLSQTLQQDRQRRAERESRKQAEETIARREHMLARTSLSPYQIACLRNIPIKTIRKAWFTLSHLLLEPNSMIAVMGCGDGTLAYAMAVLNPDFHIIGLDANRDQIAEAKRNWQLTNLEFVVSKISKPSFPNNSLDAVVDSMTLHEIYSRQGFSEGSVMEMLENHFALLKKNGLLFLRDFSHPPPGEYVMIEFPDIPSTGFEPEELSEADLLVLFSEEARSNSDEGRGFFLEELEPYLERTRLFRLPYKWAYEFILRKDNRESWDEEISKEYTFMTAREMRKTLRRLEARLLYTAPHSDPTVIRNQYEGHFRLYDDDGHLLDYPATSHIFLARKVSEGDSITLQERRPSYDPIRHLNFQSVRNTATGEIMDLVSRDVEVVEFLPYRISDTGRLHVFLHEGIPRAITNAVQRSGKNIDRKRWSGHMVEAISIDRIILSEYDDFWTPDTTQDFALRHLGLRPVNNAVLEQGPEFYPNPSMIDERIETKFLNVQKSRRSLTPRWVSQITKSFADTGKIKEFDAQHVLNAINIGLIPSARLERQILALFAFLGIAADNWAESPLYLDEADVPYSSFEKLLKIFKDDSKRFEKSNQHAGTIRSLHSYFVDEGYHNGVVKGLASRDIEFFIQENKTVNTAVVIPLIKNMSGEVLAGYVQEYLPVPERLGKISSSIRAPSFNLPPEVKNMSSAKAFIANQFSVDPDKVISLGESYFIHNGITPQRIFPFAVTSNVHAEAGPGGTFTEYAPIRWLWILVWHLYEDSFAITMRKALERMHVNIDFGIDKGIGLNAGQEHARWATPPPIGMPIPSSPEEHEAIAAEYRGSSAINVMAEAIEKRAALTDAPPPTPQQKSEPDADTDAQIQAGDPSAITSGDTSGADTSGSGSSSGNLDKSGAEAQDTKKAQQQKKKPRSSIRRFKNIDYSHIDGDHKSQEEREKEALKSKGTVVSILRPPPSRKITTPTQTTTSGPVNAISEDFDPDMDQEEFEDDLDYDDRFTEEEQPTPER